MLSDTLSAELCLESGLEHYHHYSEHRCISVTIQLQDKSKS